MLYWDRIKNWSILSEYKDFEFAGTNPCGEQPLPANGSCLLSAINLSSLVINPFTDDAYFDFNQFKKIVSDAVTELNVILDEGLPLHPIADIRESVGNWRQIGLGILGFHDMLIKMGIKYGSKHCISMIHQIGSCMIDTALMASALEAKKHGPFPKYDKDATLNSLFIKSNATEYTLGLIERYGLRNSQLLTIAPTGSTAPLVGASWAAEPIFSISYDIKTESLDNGEKVYSIFTPIISELMNALDISEKDELPDYVVTAHEIPWRKRIDVQSAWQQYIDASISSTVNVPNHIQVRDIYDLYMYAWKSGLKGVTVYRDGCKRSGVLTNTSDRKIDVCPSCGAKLEFVEGCKVCPNPECNYSACGV